MPNGYLQKQLNSGRISHAYLFIGPENTNKLATAEEFISALHCTARKNGKACNKCAVCKQIKKRIYPEILHIAPENEQILIEQVREVKLFLANKSISSGWRVVLIEKAHSLTKQAANALLKVLEEPGERQTIILLAEKANTLPNTVISRCQILKFLPTTNGINILKKEIKGEEYQKWINFFTEKSISKRIALLDKYCSKKTPAQLKEILDIWLLIWREILLENTAMKKAQLIIQELLLIKKKNNLNIKLQLENIIINYQ